MASSLSKELLNDAVGDIGVWEPELERQDQECALASLLWPS